MRETLLRESMMYGNTLGESMTKVVIASTICMMLAFTVVVSSGLTNETYQPNFVSSPLQKPAKWTVMYYMCCDSSMDEYSAPLIENLSRIKSTSALNIVLLNDQRGYGDTQLIYIDTAGEPIVLNQQLGWPNEVDTSNPTTLERFCGDMMTLFPATQYALITYASGGTGWQVYCLNDDNNGTTGVSLPVIADVFCNITDHGAQKIDVLMVSCAMGTIELSYELSPYVAYIIGTQDCLEKRTLVHRFCGLVWDLHNNSDMTAEQFARCPPARLEPHPFYYHESYYGYLPLLSQILNKFPFNGLHTVMHYPSSAVINLSTIEELTLALETVTEFLLANITASNILDDIKYARNNARESGKCYPKTWAFGLGALHSRYAFECLSYDCFVDLYHFIELLHHQTDNDILKTRCASVMDHFNATIPLIKKSLGDDHGLNIYFPISECMYNKYVLPGKLPCPYECLRHSRDTLWDDFIKDFIRR
jgi:hypothetical protein